MSLTFEGHNTVGLSYRTFERRNKSPRKRRIPPLGERLAHNGEDGIHALGQ